MAEGVGFEPTLRFPVNTLSKRAPSATRPPLLIGAAIAPVYIKCSTRAVALYHRPPSELIERRTPSPAHAESAGPRLRRRRQVVAVPQAARTIDPVRPETT